MSGGANYKWFRCYAEMVDDEKLRLVAFEDRWHFVALLCCKSSGIVDDPGPLMRRKVAVKLGLDPATFEEVARRLAEVGLIDRETLQPLAWDKRQFTSDSSAERTRAYRDRMKRHSDGAVTPPDTDTDTDTDTEEERTDSSPKKSRSCLIRPESVTELVWSDFLAIRRAKKSPMTETALSGIEREAKKAGMTLADALAVCCERGWQSFRAEWVADSKKSDKGIDWSKYPDVSQERTAPRRSAAVESGLALSGFKRKPTETIDV